jgi:hypothetical protein
MIINVSETLVNNNRVVNVALPSNGDSFVFETEGFFDICGHNFTKFAIKSENDTGNFFSIPVFVESSLSVGSDSVTINGKVFDTALSPNAVVVDGNYKQVLRVYNKHRTARPSSTVDLGDIKLPINEYGDLVLVRVAIPSPYSITDEDTVYWLGQPLKISYVPAIGWLVNLGLVT